MKTGYSKTELRNLMSAWENDGKIHDDTIRSLFEIAFEAIEVRSFLQEASDLYIQGAPMEYTTGLKRLGFL